MNTEKFKRGRYIVKAKRKNKPERWTDWTDTTHYRDALKHASRAEEAGYLAKIVVNEKQVEELWNILGKEEHEKADAILDAGFRNQTGVIREIILKIDQMICCHANGDIDDKRLYELFDKFKKKCIEPSCPDCRYFVGCECFSGSPCVDFELKRG